MSERERLPDRRAAEAINFRHGSFIYTGHVGRFDDGRIAEVFLTGSKTGTEVDVAARDSAVVASLALQHGCPCDVLRRALIRNPDGSASGPLGALLDLLAQEASP